MLGRSPLHRLYRTKLAFLATMCTITGLGLLTAATWANGSASWGWLARWPVTEISEALFTTGLIAIFFEYIGNREAEELSTQRLRRTIAEAAPDIRNAVTTASPSHPTR